MWALQNPSKQLPRLSEIRSAQKDPKPSWDRQCLTQLRRVFQTFVFFYSEAEPGQPTHSTAHDLLQELLMLALNAPCQSSIGSFVLL